MFPVLPPAQEDRRVDTILNEIEGALECGLYYLAVTSALTLPDICAALESPNGTTSKQSYKAWYDTWLAPKYPSIASGDMYTLRCAVVHEGTLGHSHSNMQYVRIVFVLTDGAPHCGFFYGNAGEEEYALSVHAGRFCKDIIDSVRQWYEAKKGDPNVIQHFPKLLQFRPDGIPPHIVGLPVIA
jgi:hypothetical protein